MNTLSTTDRDYNLWVLLHQAKDAVFKARQKELSQYGISAMEAAALFIIQAIGNKPTPAEISRWIFREHHLPCPETGGVDQAGGDSGFQGR